MLKERVPRACSPLLSKWEGAELGRNSWGEDVEKGSLQKRDSICKGPETEKSLAAHLVWLEGLMQQVKWLEDWKVEGPGAKLKTLSWKH